jgi:hypothetical protein
MMSARVFVRSTLAPNHAWYQLLGVEKEKGILILLPAFLSLCTHIVLPTEFIASLSSRVHFSCVSHVRWTQIRFLVNAGDGRTVTCCLRNIIRLFAIVHLQPPT